MRAFAVAEFEDSQAEWLESQALSHWLLAHWLCQVGESQALSHWLSQVGGESQVAVREGHRPRPATKTRRNSTARPVFFAQLDALLPLPWLFFAQLDAFLPLLCLGILSSGVQDHLIPPRQGAHLQPVAVERRQRLGR